MKVLTSLQIAPSDSCVGTLYVIDAPAFWRPCCSVCLCVCVYDTCVYVNVWVYKCHGWDTHVVPFIWDRVSLVSSPLSTPVVDEEFLVLLPLPHHPVDAHWGYKLKTKDTASGFLWEPEIRSSVLSTPLFPISWSFNWCDCNQLPSVQVFVILVSQGKKGIIPAT